MNNKFRLAQDQDCHWYVIPSGKREAWRDFCDLDQDSEEAWEVPDWADPVGGSPSNVVFDGNYEIP